MAEHEWVEYSTVVDKYHYQMCLHCPAKRMYGGNVDTGWMIKRDVPDETKKDRLRTWRPAPECEGPADDGIADPGH